MTLWPVIKRCSGILIVSSATLTIDAEDPLKVAVKDDSVSRIRKELFSPAVGFNPIYAVSYTHLRAHET